jgi:hypothetical protein
MNFEQKITKATKTDSVGFLRSLRSLLLISVLSFIIYNLSFPLCAQPPPQTENRFLFILNTSSAMRRMTNGIQQAVLGLLQSGMQGQMRDGDTFGIWNYDDQLHTDFPRTVWSKKDQGAIVENVSNWLAMPRYQKRPHLEKVLPAARQVIAQSRVVTLIFIFDGSETMQGTGFDKDINDLHKEFGRQVRADNIPFVTVLAARDGKVFDYRVRTPSSISLPLTAEFFKPPETNAVPAVAAAAPPPPAMVAPKPAEPRHLDIVLKPTPASPPKTNLPVAVTSADVQTSIDNPMPAVLPAAAPAQPVPAPAQPVVATVQPAATPVQPAPAPVQTPPAVVPAPVEPAKVPAAAPPPDSIRQSETPAAPSNPQSEIRNPQSPTTPVGRAGSPLPAAPSETPPSPAKPAPVTPVVPAAPAPVQAISPLTTNHSPLSAPAAVALPSPTDHVALLVIALALVTIAVVLVLFLIRRSRTAPSLISQSMDRPQ